MRFYRSVLFVLLLMGGLLSHAQQAQLPDSLLEEFSNASDKRKIEIYQSVIVKLWLNYPDSAMLYARNALLFAEKTNDPAINSIAWRLIGGVHNYMGNYDSSLIYNKEALKLSLQTTDSVVISSAFNNLGLAFYNVGSYASALENLLKSYNIKKKTRQRYGFGLTINNIGLIYLKLQDYDKALYYFDYALKVSEEYQDLNIALYSENNIGLTNLKRDNVDLAEEHFLRALELSKTVDNINWNATTYSGLGQVAFARGYFEKAEDFFRKSLLLKQQIGDQNGISEALYFLGKLHFIANQLDSAFFFLRHSQDLARSIGARERELDNLDLYKDLFIKIKQLDSALFYQTRYIHLRDSLVNEGLALNISEIHLKIQEEESLALLKAKDIELKQRTIIAYFMVAVTLLTLLFAVLIFRSLKIQQRLSSVLTRKNAEISNQKEEIHAQKEALVFSNRELEKAHIRIQRQNEELEYLNGQLLNTVDKRNRELDKANRELELVNLEMENFIYKSSHDLKGPLVRLLGICHVALMDVKEEKAKEYLIMLNKTANQVNDIFDRLKMLSELNHSEGERKLIDFQLVLQQVCDRLKAMPGFGEVRIEWIIEEDLLYESDLFLIDTILYNMIENAIRFRKSTSSEKFCLVKVMRNQQNLVINLTDNGIGIHQSNANHIFNMFSKAALEHQTIGLGLYTVKQCVQKLNGKVELIKGDQNFTEFEVLLPIN